MALNQGYACAHRNDPSKLALPGGRSHVTFGQSSKSRAPRRDVSQIRSSCEMIASLHFERLLQLLEQVEHLERDWLFQPRGKHRAAPHFSDPCL